MKPEDISAADFERFNKFIHSMIDNREDDLAFVLRTHILIEHELILFIQKRLKNPNSLARVMNSYGNKVALATALGLMPTLEPALKYIGSLRNRFAHSFEQELTEKEARDFRNALGPEYGKFAGDLLRLLDSEYFKPIKSGDKGLLDVLGPKEQMAQCFLAVWHLIRICDEYQSNRLD